MHPPSPRATAGKGDPVTDPARGVEWAPGPHVTERAVASERALKNKRALSGATASKNGAGNGIRTRDFDLGKVALYH